MKSLALLLAAAPLSVGADIIVEIVAPGSGAEKAGIKVGDRLVAYDGHPLLTPYTLFAWEENTFGKKSVEVRTTERAMSVAPGPLGVTSRPDLSSSALSVYLQAGAAKDPAELYAKASGAEGRTVGGAWLRTKASTAWRKASDNAQARREARTAIALFAELKDDCGECCARLALEYASPGSGPEKEQNLRAALAMNKEAGRSRWEALGYTALGTMARTRGDLDSAEDWYRKALAIGEKVAPDSLDIAVSYNSLGLVASGRGDSRAAEDWYRRALAIQERIAPRSLDHAKLLSNLGDVLFDRGEVTKSEEMYRKALALHESVEPGGLGVADAYFDLGKTAQAREDWSAAKEWVKKAISVQERHSRESLALAASYGLAGNIARGRGDLPAAEEWHKKALAIQEQLAPDSPSVAVSYVNLGNVAQGRSDLAAADAWFKKAADIRERKTPDGLPLGTIYSNLGTVAQDRGDLRSAETWHRKALSIRERKAPDSLDLAMSYNNLSGLARVAGDLVGALAWERKAIAIRQRRAPDSIGLASCFLNLGNISKDRGDLVGAEDSYRKALAILEQKEGSLLDVAGVYNNLGTLEKARGNLVGAEDWYKKALAIRGRAIPDSLDLASTYSNLGNVFYERKDFATAEDWLKKAYSIRARRALGGLEYAKSCNDLGAIARVRGDLIRAKEWHEKALAIQERETPDTLGLATSYLNLGALAADQAKNDEAERWYRKALAIQERIGPGGLSVAKTYNNLGNLARRQGDLHGAAEWHRKAMSIRQSKAPGGLDIAVSFNNLGAVEWERGDLASAAELFGKSVMIMEAQRASIASPDGRALFAECNLDAPSALIELGVLRHMNDGAFAALEQLRGRMVAEQLAEHGGEWKSGAPGELLKQQDSLINETNIARSGLIREGDDENKAKAWRARIEELGVKQRELDAMFRKDAPKYAQINMPMPLDLAGAQAVLDPGTLLLTYYLGAKKGYLFALRKDEIRVYDLAKGAHDVATEVDKYRERLQAGKDATAEGMALYDQFVRPAKMLIEASERVLISPAGALNRLPFAALVSSAKPAERGVVGTTSGYADITYFGDEKPIHQTTSMTVYAQTVKLRQRQPASTSLVAFADPDYEAYEETSKERAVGRGVKLERLPATRSEAETIAKSLGSAEVLVSSDATEMAAKTRVGKAKYLHFACHGILSDQDSLNSALALSKDSQNDGFLTAYETMQLDIAADLVTLSACQTALGEVTRSEGVIGLTRSFLFAGARTVASSLWKVQDDPTACLMTHFYENIKKGMPKDQALQLAMRATRETKVWRGKRPDWSHPKYWAAFTLTGDWK